MVAPVGSDRVGRTAPREVPASSGVDASSANTASAIDEMVAGFLGFLVGLAPLVWAATAILFFGFALEYEASWVDLLIWIPPGAIAFAAAVIATGRPWRLGVRVGLLASACASLMFGFYGLVLLVSIMVGYAVGILVGRRTHARRPPAVVAADPFAWTRRGR